MIKADVCFVPRILEPLPTACVLAKVGVFLSTSGEFSGSNSGHRLEGSIESGAASLFKIAIVIIKTIDFINFQDLFRMSAKPESLD